ncbi:serine hydrolase [Chengkuizengella sediminis]|uniref:serine hydrolase n=1 Tax=Chengkuizengella sediminis TaxID=1885917 RepID=UPI00138A3EA4|nr:serine hydrolase [Chengkuizengella sediminis]
MIRIEWFNSEKKGKYGSIVYSTQEKKEVYSSNSDLIVPLASAGKIFIGFAFARWVEEGIFNWNTIIDNIKFDPKEDGHIVYPHLQNRNSLPLHKVIEVMIACHDNFLADCVVSYAGGWTKINEKIRLEFASINLTKNPYSAKNNGNLRDLFLALSAIFYGYQQTPELFAPIISGMIRQQSGLDNIPKEHYTHLGGGLRDLILDVGILGIFTENPVLYVIAGKDVPSRNVSDELVSQFLHEVYCGWMKVRKLTQKELITK